MDTFLEFTACLALLACLMLQLLGCMMTCAVTWCTALALPADCRPAMRHWCCSLWQNAFSVHMVPETWKAWLACHPAEAWLVSPADYAALPVLLPKEPTPWSMQYSACGLCCAGMCRERFTLPWPGCTEPRHCR